MTQMSKNFFLAKLTRELKSGNPVISIHDKGDKL